ncbi:MAG TPA: hypothetical protein VMZ22_04195 [Acidimicrobiales bacterium]|nr:hypothetical protein [Acidimicrobiales bacterium]
MSGYRRTAIAACGVGLAVLATALTGPGVGPAVAGTPATLQTAGTASAIATSYKVNPTTASLSLGLSFGVSLAAYTNNVAQAEARGIDLGIIGSTLAGETCDGGAPTLPAEDQPQALRTDSREAAGPKTETEDWVPLITKNVEATAAPLGRASTTTSALTAPAALVEFGATESKAVTQLVHGTREALATVDISSVKIAGLVEFAGLHWTATYKSGALDATEGVFSIGSFKVAGESLPTGDPGAAFDAANAALSRLGIQLEQPKPHIAAGILFVDPLVVRVVPNARRDQVAGTVFSTIQPTRESIVDILLAQDCGNATYVTVADLVLGSLTGAGSFGIELGGVQAKAEPLKTSSFLAGTPLANAINGGDLGDLGGFDVFDSGRTLDAAPDALTPPAAVLDTRRNGGPHLAATGTGSRGGKLALVGLLGLAALLLFAERDRRLMRRAQRISLEG